LISFRGTTNESSPFAGSISIPRTFQWLAPRDVIHVDRAGNRLVANEIAPLVRNRRKPDDVAQTPRVEGR
jgi:hypothetical protein